MAQHEHSTSQHHAEQGQSTTTAGSTTTATTGVVSGASAEVAPLAATPVPNHFVRRLARIYPSMGTPRQNPLFLQDNITLSATSTVVTFTFPFSLMAGMVHVKTGGTAGTVTAIMVVGGDGTNTELLAEEIISTGNALSATNAVNLVLGPFLSDLNCTTFTVTITGTGVTGTGSVEVIGTSGDF